jgi:hypothetical protein
VLALASLVAVNPVPWARSQMAFTLAFHIILVPLGVSWAFMTLVAWGVDTVFGMVGHSNLGFADAMRRATMSRRSSNLRVNATRGETARRLSLACAAPLQPGISPPKRPSAAIS